MAMTQESLPSPRDALENIMRRFPGCLRRFARLLAFCLMVASLFCPPPVLAAQPPLSLTHAQFARNALQVQGRVRTAANGAVELYDMDGARLASVALKGRRFRLSLPRAALPSVPCGIVAQQAGHQAYKAVKRAPAGCAALTIRKAEWSESLGRLQVAGKGKTLSPAALDLYDLDANLLASEAPPKTGRFAFSLERAKLRTGVPCAVRVASGAQTAAAPVRKAPAGCTVLPLPTRCAIAEPASGSRLNANQPVTFAARVEAPDARAQPIRYEWDFAGGAMGHPAGTLDASGQSQTRATFVRDNSTYRVRFAATDAKGRRCEAAIDVAVGTPPTGLPPKVPEQPAPPIGGELGGVAGDWVVLPFEDLTMQSITDARLAPNQYVTVWPFSTLNAQVYRKARLPERLGSEQAALAYSAASNPADPAGANSINSTSQNWPVGASLLEAALQKADLFEPFMPSNPPADITSWSFIASTLRSTREGNSLLADEGFVIFPPADEKDERGSYMPGIGNPYQVNEPQPFRYYDPNQAVFRATLLPLSDVDDAGRVYPYPMLRAEAGVTPGQPQAATDAVLTSTRDLHCRECHEKGGIAADPNSDLSLFKAATAQGDFGANQPQFFDAPSDRLDDRELAAYWNIASVHGFYDTWIGLLAHALPDRADSGHGGHGGHGAGSSAYGDAKCSSCHSQWQGAALGDDAASASIARILYQADWSFSRPLNVTREGGREGVIGYDDSAAIHTFHGQLMYNANRTGIRRWPIGRFQRWHPEDGPNPAPLFPVVDAKGKPLPMEENCLKCHGGQREQAYRDHHYGAGLTCYQCHGDMLAVGGYYKQAVVSAEGKDVRLPWFDEPECGACHRGSIILGGTGAPGFYSAGVMDTAFDPADPSATLRRPSLGPDGARFAIPRDSFTLHNVAGIDPNDPSKSVQLPLFRRGKDTHGNVSCAACHGGAHAIWPNRDPNANDNVTAMQLQGHTGSVLECNVCHTADAFLKKDDLDGGVYMGVPAGVLGGPHNLHPVNDPNWWKEATGQADGKAGWHDDYARRPGAAGEDQCAACHGNNHKGSRLSKTPVAREFIDENGKKVKVKAGAPIGCDLCHSIEKSCQKSPNPRCGGSEGYTDPVNHPPVFTSAPVEQAVLGELYQAKVSASDPDGDPVTLRLTANPSPPNPDNPDAPKLEFDAATGTLTADWMLKEGANNPGIGWQYVVTADDGRGGLANFRVKVKLACPRGLVMHPTQGCRKLRFATNSSVYGLDAGQTFIYAAKVEHADSLPVTFSLPGESVPPGMTVSPDGVITFNTGGITEETGINTFVKVADGIGNEDNLDIVFVVCVGANKWNEIAGVCLSPITISTRPPAIAGINVGETLVHHVSATHKQNRPLTFSLSGAPSGMSIDAGSGHLEWTADVASEGTHTITLTVTDGAGGIAKQTFGLTVCKAPQIWNAELGRCKGPISITSPPPGVDLGVYGMDVGQILTYDVTATHEQNLPLAFSIEAGPAGLSITRSGHIDWTADAGGVGSYQTVTVSARDGQGGLERQSFYLTVCGPPQHWDASQSACVE